MDFFHGLDLYAVEASSRVLLYFSHLCRYRHGLHYILLLPSGQGGRDTKKPSLTHQNGQSPHVGLSDLNSYYHHVKLADCLLAY